MAYFVLALMAIIIVGGGLAVGFAFVYALYIKFFEGDERSILDIFGEL